MLNAACASTPRATPIPQVVPSRSVVVAPTQTAQPKTASPTQSEPTAQPSLSEALPTPTSAPAFPTRLLIPKLKIDETIVTIPIVDGEWDISGLGSNVGWLTTTGPTPKADWAMAFVGHVSLDTGISGPFGYLWQLRPGAEIILQTESAEYIYALTEKRDVGAEAVKELYIADGQQIVLMTCDNWDFANWRYTERLLALAKLVEERPVP